MTDYKDVLYKIIGQKIKSIREDLKMSQYDLSQRLDISRSSISNIEVGRHQVPLHLLFSISEILETNINSLIPTLDEINNFINHVTNDYSSFLDTTFLKDEQKEVLCDVIKNIEI